MVIPIRPHHIFDLVEKSCDPIYTPKEKFLVPKEKSPDYSKRLIKLTIPDPNSGPILETVCLITLAKIVKAKTFFEFGTYLGIQTLNIAVNLPSSFKLFTLDFSQESFRKATQHKKDKLVSQKHFEHEVGKYGLEDKLAFRDIVAGLWDVSPGPLPLGGEIVKLYGDSNEFDFSRFHRKIDMIYIDGGHDYRTVKSDSKNAFAMLSHKEKYSHKEKPACQLKPACIAWHDYNNPRYGTFGVDKYLDELSERVKLFHIGDTNICFYAQGWEIVI